MLLTFGLWLIAVAPAGAVECAAPTTRIDLLREVERMEAAWSRADLDDMQRAEVDLRQALLCVSEALSTSDVAKFWRVEALWYHVIDARDDALDALRAARVAQPEYELSTELVPSYHPLRTLWDLAASGDLRTRELPISECGRLEVDGVYALAVPEARSYVLQSFRDGVLVATTIQPVGAIPSAPACLLEPPRWRPPRSTQWLIAGGLGAEVVALVLTGVSMSLTKDVVTATNVDSLELAHSRKAAAGYGAYGMYAAGALSVSVGAVLWVGKKPSEEPDP
jgi:hypothetical protein